MDPRTRAGAHRHDGSALTGASSYEYRELVLPRGTSRGEARQVLTEHAEYGRWELATVRLFVGGTRRVTLRRKIIRMPRSA